GKSNQTLCAIGISKFVLKYAGGSWKNKTIPFLDALEMVGHDVTELRALEARSENGNVVLWPKEQLEFKSFEGWTDRAAAVGNALDLCETMLLQDFISPDITEIHYNDSLERFARDPEAIQEL
ncbi:hypothetical protein CPC16_005354, partial [Podila verticillata]